MLSVRPNMGNLKGRRGAQPSSLKRRKRRKKKNMKEDSKKGRHLHSSVGRGEGVKSNEKKDKQPARFKKKGNSERKGPKTDFRGAGEEGQAASWARKAQVDHNTKEKRATSVLTFVICRRHEVPDLPLTFEERQKDDGGD